MDKRIVIALYCITLFFVLFILRLWDLQIIKGGEYKRIAERNRLRIIEIPAPRGLVFDRNNNALVKNVPSFDISAVKDDVNTDPQTLSAIGKLIGTDPRDIGVRLRKASNNPFEPVKLKLDVTMEEVAMVEAMRTDFPVLQVEVVVGREYIHGDFASHAIGYLGHLTLQQARDPDYLDVPSKAFIGQMGIEKIYDRSLRGVAGKKFVEVDAMGRVIKIAGVQPPVKGEDIRLTIDSRVQQAAEDAMKGKAGSVVVLDVHTGEILALTSKPSFDPNHFARGIHYSEWNRLISDPLKPFLNRSVQSQYPPGSVFKPVVALAALEEGIITETTKFRCTGSMNIGRVFKCWKDSGHGYIDVHKAIVESCDVFFYEIGRRLNIDTLARFAKAYGLGSLSGLEIEGERSGIVPSTEWKFRTKNQKWYLGESLNTVIGQGYLSTTPIQIARMTAALVNGGRVLRPRLVLEENNGADVEWVTKIHPQNMMLIMNALGGVVSEKNGTGKEARSDVVSIGGKTGTTQVVSGDLLRRDIPEKYRDHAWFIAFAPQENPEIALAVFVEHGGHGSTAAAPVAKKVIEAYFQ
jgi:penicillin-binding protein 2